MYCRPFHCLIAVARPAAQVLRRRLLAATKPVPASVIAGTLTDLVRSKPQLIAENALLRQQLIILRRSVNRPRCTATDRALLVLLVGRLRTWRETLLIVQPDTLLRWHRNLFRCFWRRKSRATTPAHRPPIAPETITLIREMAAANRTWGAERIRGELLKLRIRLAKATIQKYMRGARPPRHSGQTWATFLHNHAHGIWACDFLPVTDLLFRSIHAFFVIELATRRIVHVGVTRHPTDVWVTQQLREATPFGRHPKHLIRDNDTKLGPAFRALAAATSVEDVRTAYRAPKENAVCERLMGSVRRECLDHMLTLNERHLLRVLSEYVQYYNSARPHQGLHQRIPDPPASPGSTTGAVHATPVLGGLHHSYARAA
jgi:putative transposase